MIIAIVGSGGKTTLIKKLTQQYRLRGKSVFVTTTTHMFIEKDTLLTDDAGTILGALRENGYAMAGIPQGEKIKALSKETFDTVCAAADVVLVEADGSKHLPLKFPNGTEPVIPENTDEVIVVCGLNALEQPAKNVCHRLELVKQCLGIGDDALITPLHVQKLVTQGYLLPLRKKYPHMKIRVSPRHDGTLYQRAVASLLENEQNVSMIRREWFCPQPKLIICGGGHVSREVALFAHRLDFPVTVLDDRAEAVTRERFPTAEQLICDSYDHLGNYLEEDACYVVATPAHRADLQCVSTILPTRFRYLGMIGSRKKADSTLENLENAGFSQEQVDRIFAPIGLPIGAATPAEIALSILGQIIQEKNNSHAAFADRALLESREPGTLCVIIEKHGSAPRGVGSMMFVGQNQVIGSIGGGETEYLAICHAKEHQVFSVKEYTLRNTAVNGLDMICGGSVKIAFIPIS